MCRNGTTLGCKDKGRLVAKEREKKKENRKINSCKKFFFGYLLLASSFQSQIQLLSSPNLEKSPEFITKPPRTEKLRDSEERRTSHERMFYEKDIFHLPPISKRYHSWYYFLLIMIVGLVAPPVYYLVTLGVMDRRRSRHGPQPRFLRGQKLVSLVIGIVWILVVLAMMGVGFGIGTS